MKKIILTIVLLTIFMGIIQPIFAQTPNQQLEDLKDRLATKVAQMREVIKQAAYGKVASITLTGATLETPTKTLKIEFDDEVVVTRITGGKRTTLSTDDIKKDDIITIFGSFDATLELLKASAIFIESIPSERIRGTVTEIDTKMFVISVTTPEGRTMTVDIEKSTKTNLWNAIDGISKAGFSKIAIGDVVHVVGKTDAKKEDHMSAVRILDLGKLL